MLVVKTNNARDGFDLFQIKYDMKSNTWDT